jgi:hypothetical protein
VIWGNETPTYSTTLLSTKSHTMSTSYLEEKSRLT